MLDNQPSPSKELLPCPFCSCKKSNPYVKYDPSTDDCWQVECGYCCGSAPTAYSKKEAIQVWNTRAQSKQLTATQQSLDSAVAALKFISDDTHTYCNGMEGKQDYHSYEDQVEAYKRRAKAALASIKE